VDTGQFIPAWAGNRVVYGHPLEAIDAETKKAEAARFYSPDGTAAERRALLDRYGVQYVFLSAGGPLTQGRLEVDVAALSLVQVWARGDAVLYRVEARP